MKKNNEAVDLDPTTMSQKDFLKAWEKFGYPRGTGMDLWASSNSKDDVPSDSKVIIFEND